MAISGGRTLMVYLAADTANFKRNMNQAETTATGFGSKISSLGSSLTNMLGPALIGAGIAAGAMAVKFGADGVQAFMDDEAAANKLATTLGNLGFADATASVEAMIDSQQRLTGQSDEKLRPAYDRLIRSTHDVGEATRALKLAEDIAAGTGKDLESVTNALGKAYDGNTVGLGKLGIGLDKATLATGDMDVINKALAKTFDGQAATAASTYTGQIDRLKVGFSELQESLGRGFMGAVGDTNAKTDDLMQTMKDLEPVMQDIGTTIGNTFTGLIDATIAVYKFQQAWEDLSKTSGGVGQWATAVGTSLYNQIVGPLVVAADAISLLKGQTAGGAADSRAGQGYVPMSGGGGGAAGGPSMGGGNSGAWANFYAVNASGSKAWAEANQKLNQGLIDLNPEVVKLAGGGGASKDAFISVKDAIATASEQINTQFAPALKMAEDALSAVRQKAVEYADSIKNAITGTISLSTAWSSAVAGGSINKGADALAILQTQLKDTDAFTKAFADFADNPEVNQLLAGQVISLMQAQGPTAGVEFINAMTPAMSQKLSEDLQALDIFAGKTGVEVSKKFYDQGTEDAVAMLNGISAEIAAQQKGLKQLGENIGGPIADEVTKQIQRAIRNGLAAGQAEADRQEAAAFALSASSRVTQTAVGQGITAVVRQVDQRTGSLPAAALR